MLACSVRATSSIATESIVLHHAATPPLSPFLPPPPHPARLTPPRFPAVLSGSGTDRDHESALMYYRAAADQGHSKAQAYLGFVYATGHNGMVRWGRGSMGQGGGGWGEGYRVWARPRII